MVVVVPVVVVTVLPVLEPWPALGLELLLWLMLRKNAMVVLHVGELDLF